jgi:hypothetical protein
MFLSILLNLPAFAVLDKLAVGSSRYYLFVDRAFNFLSSLLALELLGVSQE